MEKPTVDIKTLPLAATFPELSSIFLWLGDGKLEVSWHGDSPFAAVSGELWDTLDWSLLPWELEPVARNAQGDVLLERGEGK